MNPHKCFGPLINDKIKGERGRDIGGIIPAAKHQPTLVKEASLAFKVIKSRDQELCYTEPSLENVHGWRGIYRFREILLLGA